MISRRRFLKLGGLAALTPLFPVLTVSPARAAALEGLVFAGPPAPISLPLARLADSPAIKELAVTVQMRQWRDPDIMRTWMVSKEVQATAVPVNAAAALYNKGVNIRLLDINKGGVLSVMTSDTAVKTFADLKGNKLLAFYRGDIPDLAVRFLATKLGLVPDKDMDITYAGSPFEAMGLFLSGRAQTVLLPEPAATAAMMKGTKAGLNIRRIPLQNVWEEVTGNARFMPLGATICQDSLITDHPEAALAIRNGLGQAVSWVNANPSQAAKSYAGMFDLKPPLLEASLKAFPLAGVSGAQARKELESFLSALMAMSPKLLGGRLPDAGFYQS